MADPKNPDERPELTATTPHEWHQLPERYPLQAKTATWCMNTPAGLLMRVDAVGNPGEGDPWPCLLGVPLLLPGTTLVWFPLEVEGELPTGSGSYEMVHTDRIISARSQVGTLQHARPVHDLARLPFGAEVLR